MLLCLYVFGYRTHIYTYMAEASSALRGYMEFAMHQLGPVSYKHSCHTLKVAPSGLAWFAYKAIK